MTMSEAGIEDSSHQRNEADGTTIEGPSIGGNDDRATNTRWHIEYESRHALLATHSRIEYDLFVHS